MAGVRPGRNAAALGVGPARRCAGLRGARARSPAAMAALPNGRAVPAGLDARTQHWHLAQTVARPVARPSAQPASPFRFGVLKWRLNWPPAKLGPASWQQGGLVARPGCQWQQAWRQARRQAGPAPVQRPSDERADWGLTRAPWLLGPRLRVLLPGKPLLPGLLPPERRLRGLLFGQRLARAPGGEPPDRVRAENPPPGQGSSGARRLGLRRPSRPWDGLVVGPQTDAPLRIVAPKPVKRPIEPDAMLPWRHWGSLWRHLG